MSTFLLGTGDVHLTLVQNVPLTGAIIVSTPQEVALADARKGINMFRMDSLKVPVLGIVENMAWFTPEELPNKYYIFGKDGASNLAAAMNVPLLAQIPLIQSVREAGDVGRPAVLQDNTLSSKVFDDFVQKFLEGLRSKILNSDFLNYLVPTLVHLFLHKSIQDFLPN
ncbi:MAG: P-loop NTPase [Crocinitomicaceae bacterium]|nr:P-loop NTPase [Crocinitomicaceae bacterium]